MINLTASRFRMTCSAGSWWAGVRLLIMACLSVVGMAADLVVDNKTISSAVNYPTSGTVNTIQLGGTSLTIASGASVTATAGQWVDIQAGTWIKSGSTVRVRMNVPAPTANPQTLSTPEDVLLPITLAGSGPTGNPLTYAIVTAPTKGALIGTAPNLQYAPNANVNGSDSFSFTVNDGLNTSTAAVVTINVLAVNDPPVFAVGPNQSVPDTASAQAIVNWATGVSPGPNEAAQKVTFTCTGFDPVMFLSAPAVTQTGSTATLSYTPSGKIGTTSVSVVAMDDGDTANGGKNTSSAQTFTITVSDSVLANLPVANAIVEASHSSYPTATTSATAADRLTTTFTYQWWTGFNQISKRTTTLPAVSVATNGSGVATTLVEVLDASGRPVWLRDGDGYLTYITYDDFTGAPASTIQDVDTTKSGDFAGTAPFSTPVGSATQVAGGAHLKSRYEVDSLGRQTAAIDPKGTASYTVYNDLSREVRVYPSWDASAALPTGPTRVTRDDWGHQYREILTMSAVPAVVNGRPSGTEAIASLQSLRRESLDGNGRAQYVDSYVDLTGITYSAATSTLGAQRTYVAPPATPTGNYERIEQTYTSRGFPDRSLRADGTVERTVSDVLGRITAIWKGTSDVGWTATGGDLAAFKLVGETIYDGGGVGLGLVTTSRIIGDDTPGTGRAIYATTYAYDAFGRRTRALGPDGVLTDLTLDNLGRTTQADTYAGATSVAALPASANLRGRQVLAYDALGRAWKTTTYEVQSSDGSSPGTVGNALIAQQWYDQRGHILKSQAGTSGAFAKSRFDGVGRMVYAWNGCDSTETAALSDASSSAGDVIAEATLTHYDTNSNPVAVTRFIRPDNATVTGDLTALNSLLSVRVQWYDRGNRPTATADYGRDNGSTRYVWDATGNLLGSNGIPNEASGPARSPNSSDDYRVSQIAYDAAGRPWRSTDNLGRISESTYDAAGRVVQTIANRVDGVVSAGETDTDQTTKLEYAVGGGVAVQRALVATGAVVTQQTTRYLRTDAIDRSWVTAVIYPDSTDTSTSGTDQVQTALDRLGRPRSRTDQRGVVRSFTYDAAGRSADDIATTVPVGVDATVRRLSSAYDELGRLRSRTSWDATSGGTTLDEVRRTRDGWGHILATAQAHDGAYAAGTTPSIAYAWDAGASAGIARSLRLVGATYPTASFGVGYRYPASGLGAALDRPEAVTSGGVDIAQAEYLGAGALARVTMPQAGNARIERSAGGTAGGYTRFWQMGAHVWTMGATAVDGTTQIYDRAGRVTARQGAWSVARSDRDDVATYDGLDRLASFKRGQASAGGVLSASASVRDWSWTLDQGGNWRSYSQDLDGGFGSGTALIQSRSHNQANEIDTTDSHADPTGNSISGAGVDWVDPVYDAAGDMTTMPTPGAETSGRTLVWDAWGRLVRVANGATTVWTARYDAEHRLIRWTDVAAGKTSDAYLDEQGRDVEVRVGGLIAEVYVWASNSDRLLRYGRGSGGTITAQYGVLSDAQGSVTALVADGTSTVVERYRYDAYGVRTILGPDSGGNPVLSVSAYAMRFAFTGRPQDPVLGLISLRARWYHPSLGRFISRDPMGYVDGGNLYAFVRDMPLSFVDPSGMQAALYDYIYHGGPISATLQSWSASLEQMGMQSGSGTVAGLLGIMEFGLDMQAGAMAPSSYVDGVMGYANGVANAYNRDGLGAAVLRGAPGIMSMANGLVGFDYDHQRSLDGFERGTQFANGFGTFTGTAAALASPMASMVDGALQRMTNTAEISGIGGDAISTGNKLLGSARGGAAAEASRWQGAGQYPGVDIYTNATLPKGSRVVGAVPGPSPYYTTLEGFQSTGGTAEGYYQGLQVQPNTTNLHYPMYRNGVTVYEAAQDIPVATAPTLANPQFGAGGVNQIYIPGFKTQLNPLYSIPFRK